MAEIVSTLKKSSSRRWFLKTVLAGAAGTSTLAHVGSIAAESANTADKSAERKDKGYRETAHVRKYYSTLKT